MREFLTEQRTLFATGQTKPYQFRRQQLLKLMNLLRKNEQAIHKALHDDLNKPLAESFVSEYAVVMDEIHLALRHLRSWMKGQCVRTPLHLWPARTRVYREPLGSVLIIGPWNYPVQLTLSPLVAALAAGNCAIIKPSELAAATSKLIAKMLSEEFDPGLVRVVEGGIQETADLLALPFDHILFTGSTRVGKIVYQAAAKNLTPVTLELGGKSPVIVDGNCDLEVGARRITWGKFLNAGQTCIAPDYAYIHESVEQKFIELVKKNIRDFYGEDPAKSDSYARLLNTNHLNRLRGLIDSQKLKAGGQFDAGSLYLAPTVVGPVSWNDPVMQEEIFGPILPYLTYSDLNSTFQEIKKRDKPLAAYFFSNDCKNIQTFLDMSFGGGCVNDTVVHISNGHAPFGGVGASGTGAYHGERGFLALSHQKTVVHKARWADLSVRYPPYTDKKLSFLRRLFSR